MRIIVCIALINCLSFQTYCYADELPSTDVSSDQYYRLARTVPSDASPCDFSCVNEVYPYAKLSQGTYKNNDLESWGDWQRIHVDSNDVDSNFAKGYRASIYQNDARKEIVIAYTGTTIEVSDFITNIEQYFGQLPDQYEDGVVTALSYIENNDQNYSIVLTGHSLGGGIAQYVAKVLDQKAITFNSAPINRGNAYDAIKLNEEYVDTKPAVLGNFSVLNIVALDEKQNYDFVADTTGELFGTTKYVDVSIYQGFIPDTFDWDTKERHSVKTLVDQLMKVMLAGKWTGYVKTGGSQHTYNWELFEFADDIVKGIISISDADNTSGATYEIEGTVENGQLLFSGVRFIENYGGLSWCMASGTLKLVFHDDVLRLFGDWGELNIEGGCPSGSSGVIFLSKKGIINNETTSSNEKKCKNGPAIEQVQFNDLIHCSIDNPGDVNVYSIELNKGDNIHIPVYTTDGDDCEYFLPRITARDSNNKVLTRTYNNNGSCSGDRMGFVADEAGTYTITVHDADYDRMGNYNIEFQCVSGGCVNNTQLAQTTLSSEKKCNNGLAIEQVLFNDLIHCSIDNPGDVDVYSIELNKGDNIHVSVYTTGGDDCEYFLPIITARDSKNKVLTRTYNNNGSCSGDRIGFVADEAGTYTITVHDTDNDRMGNYNVEFQCVSGSCVSIELLAKQECSATFDGSSLIVPQLELDNKDFWVNFKLFSANPIQFQLTGFGER